MLRIHSCIWCYKNKKIYGGKKLHVVSMIFEKIVGSSKYLNLLCPNDKHALDKFGLCYDLKK